MKILFIHNKYKHNGGEDVALELETSVLSQKGHEVRTLFFDNKQIDGFLSKIRTAFAAVYNFSSARETSKTILRFKPDIIHIHNLFFIASPSILDAAYKHKVPVVLSLHNYRLLCANALLMRNEEICELCIHKKFPLHGIRHKCYRNSSVESALVTTITGFHKLIGTWKSRILTFIAFTEFSRGKFLNSSQQNMALEWLYRVIQQPQRLFTRYFYTNSYFIFLLARHWAKHFLNPKMTDAVKNNNIA